MAYLGTPPRSRVLSSADIDPGSVSLDDISFTDQPASMNISGNIDKHTMRLADQVVVNGDLDITDNLILSKISDDGNAIILTNDSSTRTIEGTGGSLEASTLTQTPNASLTGMTGEIGSAVTFPAGHILQVLSTVKTDTQSYHNTSGNVAWQDITGLSRAITPVSTSNKILINFNITYGSSTYAGFFKIQRKIGSGSYADLTGAMGDAEGSRTRMTAGTAGGTAENEELTTGSMIYLDSPSTTSEVTYKILYTSRHNDYMYINRTHTHTNADYAGLGISTITCMEVSG